jgi:hypothetical protein
VAALPLLKFRTQLNTVLVQVLYVHKLQIPDDQHLTV